MNKFEEIKKVIADAQEDADKFYQKGNGAAGRRVRKALQQVAVLAKAGRAEVIDLGKP